MKCYNITLMMLTALIILFACKKPDYTGFEQYTKEAYIISSGSTSSVERELTSLQAHSFVDTIKFLNMQYDSDTIIDRDVYSAPVIFKVGVGGSVPLEKDIEIVVGFDEQLVIDYNNQHNTSKRIPSAKLYSTNIPFDQAKNGFPVIVKKGTASAALQFNVPIHRDSLSTYDSYAFPLKISAASEGVPVNKYREGFLIAGLLVSKETTVNWSGIPIPKIPTGRYLSSQLSGNAAENSPGGRHRRYKYITPLSVVDNPALNDKYMIWGTSAWSWEVFGFHGAGWMYNTLTLTDKNFGLYRIDPILAGSLDFPAQTFAYSTVQRSTEGNTYDPRSKVLTVRYSNVIGQNYTDVLTFVDSSLILDVVTGGNSSTVQSWAQVASKGYKYWLPAGQ